jgi:outer membrane protein OmpA-like peptidoglycan-associated protein
MKRFLSLVLLGFTAWALGAETFRFMYREDDKYRILSTVNESVYINRVLSHRANILNRIAVHVVGVEQNRGRLSCVFQTSEESRNSRNVFSWGKTYESEFFRDALGHYEIDSRYFMPIVRNVPVFPEKNLLPGDSWTAPGEEAHDFSASFGIKEAVRFPIDVTYRYAGMEEWKGQRYHVINIAYNVFYRPKFDSNPGPLFPVLIAGFSRQKLYWDSRRGRPQAYEEEFNFIFNLSTGDSVEYRGTAEAEIVESSSMDKGAMVEDIRDALKELGVSDTEVRQDDLGVTLTLDNIQFPPDSAFLIKAEQEKLDRIGEILKKYPDRDILITGHTAFAGTAEGRQKLSEDRAASVGAYLLERGVRAKERMIYRGLGADVPAADNTTEEGRIKNRRVEITILEN